MGVLSVNLSHRWHAATDRQTDSGHTLARAAGASLGCCFFSTTSVPSHRERERGDGIDLSAGIFIALPL